MQTLFAIIKAFAFSLAHDTILQEYAPGEEFGVFYYRYPDEERGHIFSLTEKKFPVVTGDGRSTLEQLILSDDRACLRWKPCNKAGISKSSNSTE